MSGDLGAAIVGGIAGVVTGAISGLAAPWSQLAVEHRRLRRVQRVELITEARRELVALTENNGSPTEAMDAEWFLRLRPHLQSDVLRTLYTDAARRQIVVTPSGALPGFVWTLRDELDRLQRKWRV